MNPTTNRKGLAGVFAYTATASANNLTSGILAYIMLTYAEVPSTTVAMVMTMPAIVGTIFAFASGSIMNRIGAKRLTIFVHTMEFLSGMIYLFLGNKTSVYVLWIAAAMYGFLMGASNVILGQLLLETVPDASKRGSFLGYASSVMSLGGVFFASVGGILAARDGGAHWESAYMLYFLILISLVLEVICLPDDHRKKTAKEMEAEAIAAGVLKDDGEINPGTGFSGNASQGSSRMPLKVWMISLHYTFFFLFLYAFSLNVSEYVITTHALGTSVEAGFVISCVTVGGIISGAGFGFYNKLLKKFTVPVMMSLAATGLALAVFLPNIYVLYLGSILLGISMMGCGPYIITELAELTSGVMYAKAMSIYAGFMNVGMMVAVYVLAFLANLFTGDSTSVDGKLMIAFVGAVIVAVTSVPIYVGSNKK